MDNNRLNYKKILECEDFEYYFRFKRSNKNFNELWRMKSSARESLKEWLYAIQIDPEKADVIANACSELIENTIKYSLEKTFSYVSIRVEDKDIYIDTVNKSEPKPRENLKALIKRLENKKTSLEDLYIQKLTESVKRKNSELGLIKLLLETLGKLECIEEDTENTIHIKVYINADKIE